MAAINTPTPSGLGEALNCHYRHRENRGLKSAWEFRARRHRCSLPVHHHYTRYYSGGCPECAGLRERAILRS